MKEKQSRNLNSHEKQSEKPKVKKLEFTHAIQKEIFASILFCSRPNHQDLKYVYICMAALEPISFDNSALRDFFKIIKEHYNKHNSILTEDQFLEEYKNFMNLDKNRNLPDDEYAETLYEILAMARGKDFDYSKDKIIQFAQHQAVKYIMMDSARKRKHMAKLNIGALIEDLEKVRDMNIEFEDEDAGFKLIPLSEVEAKEIEWLWYKVIPRSNLTIICGDPGVGKSFLTTFLACNLSIGKSLPHTKDEKAIKGSILMLAAEDNPEDTIKPRVINMKGNTSKIIIMEGIKEKNIPRIFDFDKDIQRLDKLLRTRKNIKLVIIDPITAYMRKIDMKMDAEIRSTIIHPLSNLAKRHKISVILVAHLNKNTALKAVYRIAGSVGFLAGARTVWLVIDDIEDKTGEKRKLCCLKMNIAKKPKMAMIFKIFEDEKDKPKLVFTDEIVFVNLESELSGKEKPIHMAEEFLKEFLKYGKRKATEAQQAAKANDIKDMTLRRARARMMIKITTEDGRSYWTLPKESAIIKRKNKN